MRSPHFATQKVIRNWSGCLNSRHQSHSKDETNKWTETTDFEANTVCKILTLSFTVTRFILEPEEQKNWFWMKKFTTCLILEWKFCWKITKMNWKFLVFSDFEAKNFDRVRLLNKKFSSCRFVGFSFENFRSGQIFKMIFQRKWILKMKNYLEILFRFSKLFKISQFEKKVSIENHLLTRFTP